MTKKRSRPKQKIDLTLIGNGEGLGSAQARKSEAIFSFVKDFLTINQSFSNIGGDAPQLPEKKGSLFEKIFYFKNEELTFVKKFLSYGAQEKNKIKLQFTTINAESGFVFVKDSNEKLVGIANKEFNCDNKDDPDNFLIIVKQTGFDTTISQEYLKLNESKLKDFLGFLEVDVENVVQDGGDKEENRLNGIPENQITPLSANNAKTGESVKQNRNRDILDAVAKAVLLYNGNNRFGLRQTGVLTLEGENLDIKFANESTIDEETKSRAINNFQFLFQQTCHEKSITLANSNEVLTFDKLTNEEKQHVSQNLQQRIYAMTKIQPAHSL